MKTFLIGYEVKDGESEYKNYFTIQAYTIDKATEEAVKILDLDKWTDSEKGMRIYVADTAQEISEIDLKVIRKYIPVYDEWYQELKEEK